MNLGWKVWEAMPVAGLLCTIRVVDQHVKGRMGKQLSLPLVRRKSKQERTGSDRLRSIPSMVDGLKPGQKSILFFTFKRNIVKEARVAQFSCCVSEHSTYHNGE
ncbi:uncharacterized protein LOC130780288 isoform X2 [Actinidia eriantha]|uniref:uncharacterized protein LOC130780288 isoform X2 n=1 Tax=Actinidia eriantha TaxID=165200 RepID=UPI0025912100|nr:uncharacterized protein LOC130780288 isoform X2 [Actinidia eriantha]